VSLGDDLIEVLRLGWGEGVQGKVIDDEQIRGRGGRTLQYKISLG